MAVSRLTCKYISSTGSHTLAWRGFVSATIPSHKVDKETCAKVIDTAETVKDHTKEVVNEVKRVGKAATDKAINATGTVTADLAKKGFEQAADSSSSEKSKDFFDTGKNAAEALKDKMDKKLK